MKITIGQYRKFIVGIAGQVLTFASLYYGTNHWVAAAVAVAMALGIYGIPNDPKPPVKP